MQTANPTLVFKRPISGARPGDITYTPERNSTLTGNAWSPNGMVMEAVPDGMQQETVTVRSTTPLGSLESEYLRLKVTKP